LVVVGGVDVLLHESDDIVWSGGGDGGLAATFNTFNNGPNFY
jgi:hypothetical protein